jgi:hypothetical protein
LGVLLEVKLVDYMLTLFLICSGTHHTVFHSGYITNVGDITSLLVIFELISVLFQFQGGELGVSGQAGLHSETLFQ